MNTLKLQHTNYIPSFYAKPKNAENKSSVSKPSSEQIQTNNVALSHELELKTEDNVYRANLLKSVGISDSPYTIKSIMGPNETKQVLGELDKSEENFIASPENIESGKFRANLHIHTLASDGYYSPKELLEDSAKYANKVFEKTGKPFVIAITDHDTINSYPDVIKEVHENHDKYKNLKVIMGMESTTFDDVKGKPIQFHMLVYNIDPSDKKFVNFLESQKEKKYNLSKKVIKNINSEYKKEFDKGDLFSFEEYTNMYPPMKKGVISPHNYLRNYAMTKFLVKEVVPNMEILNNYFSNSNPDKKPEIEMNRIKAFQYIGSHNNKADTALSGVRNYYSQAAGIDPDIFSENLYNQAKKSEKVLNFIEKVNPKLYAHRNIEGENFYVNISEVSEALSNQPKATLGIAHPLSCVIDGAPNSFDAFANVLYPPAKSNSPKESRSEEFINNFYEMFKQTAKDRAGFSERYYQSYSLKKDDIQTPPHMQICIDKLSEDYNLLRTGGYDSHRKTIFSRY